MTKDPESSVYLDYDDDAPQGFIDRGAEPTQSIDLTGLMEELDASGKDLRTDDIEATPFGKLMEAVPIPVLLLDRDRRITFLNQAVGRISAKYDLLRGKECASLFADAKVGKLADSLIKTVCFDRQVQVIESVVQIGDSRIWGRVHLQPLRWSSDTLVLALIEDLTLEKKQLSLQKKVRKELEKRVEERTRDLGSINERLQREIGERKRAESELIKHRQNLERLVVERTSDLNSTVARMKQEVKERKKAEERLRVQTERFRMLSENAPFGMVMISKEGVFGYVNPKFKEIFGYDLSDVPNGREWFRKAYPDPQYRHEAISAWIEDLRGHPGGETRSRIFAVTCKNGSQKIIHFRPVKLATSEDLMTCEDITDLKRSEEQIRASLKEKDAMLGEIHHRVKNNLAVVSSLLRSQSRYATDEPHRRMFKECETRVTSMVLAHELLYRSENLSDIRVDEYVSRLLDYLVGAMKTERGSVDLKKEIEDVVLGLDKVVPLGLIVSELVSNSLEHAFPEKRKGKILVSLRSLGERDLELVVRDDGVGMPEDVDLQGGTSMGLELVRILAAQLGGKIKIVTDKGTQVSIRFGVGNS